MAGVHRVGADGVVLTQALGLCVRHDCQGDLGELGQVQNTLWVHEGLLADAQRRGIAVDDVTDAKAQCFAGVLVGAAPDLACGWGSVAVALAHALGLDALAWVDISGARLCKQCLAPGNDFAAYAARDLEGRVDTLAAHALDDDVNDIVQLNHAVHGVGPAHDLTVPRGQVLRSGREPHAVDQRCLEVHQLCGVVGGVNGVVVAGDQREWGHVVRRGDGPTIHEGARRGLDLGGRLAAAPLRRRLRHRGAGGAAADGKALHLGCDDLFGAVVFEL